MRREISAGGVVFKRGDLGPEIPLIHDAYGRWSLPKGLVEDGESLEEAALREILEETGVKGSVQRQLGDTHYFYTGRDGGLVSKTVRYYLVQALSDELRPLLEEINGAQWMGVEDALKNSSYPSNRDILKEARELLLEPGMPDI